MSIFEKFGSIAVAGRGSRPSRPRIPGKVRAWFSAMVGMTAPDNNGAGHSGEQASRPASFSSGDRQA